MPTTRSGLIPLRRRWLAAAVLLLGALLIARGAGAQQAQPTLTITVVDPTGALIVGATVGVTAAGSEPLAVQTGGNGAARVVLPRPGRVDVRVDADGFEPGSIENLQVRGNTRHTVKLALARVYETVDVGRDPRNRASDPRSDVFATILGAAEIQELPDDPDEMERVLREMAGPGAVMRVNGFRGGRLPPKEQIAQIRFRRNMFAADAHEPGFLAVDVVTKPGFENWQGSSGVALRDDALNARQALAPARGDEHHTRGSFTLGGPLWRKHTSLALSVDGTDAYDSQTIVAANLAGAFARTIRRPTTLANVSARVEHALTPTQQLRAEVQRGHAVTNNLGVGNFDLESRAYSQTRDDAVFRGSLIGALGKAAYNELRVSWRTRNVESAPQTAAPTVSVLNAFTAGGAQVEGARTQSVFELADDLDLSRGRHAVRLGLLLERGRHQTTEQRNALGTFTFADLAAFAAECPTTFTRTLGLPDASVTETQFASYVQDDLRVSRSLTLSGGIRQEYQSNLGGLHLGPRGGFAWSPFRSGRTTLRGGGGVFFDWFDADDALRARQLDSLHQQVETIVAPAFPQADTGAGVRLSNGRIQLAEDLAQPELREVNLAVEHTAGPARLNVMLVHRRGRRELRGIDVNAPVGGARPAPEAGPVTEMRSIARSGVDALSLNLNIVRPERRLFVAANYTLSRSFDETDSPFGLPADAADLAAERGPALDDARHRAMGFASMPIWRGVAAGVSFSAQSARPYDLTTGRDDNGDTISSDRPSGVGRNVARGRTTLDVSARLSWRGGFGGPAPQGPGGPQVRVVRAGGDANPLAGMPAGRSDQKYGVELYAQVFNATNHFNAVAFGGVLASPFYGRPIATSAPRRIELGARLSF